MKPAVARWTIGICAWSLPAVITAMGIYLDHSPWRNASAYATIIPIAGWGSLLVAAIVPPVLILQAPISVPWRVAGIAAAWSMLLLELFLLFTVVMTGTGS